MYQLSSRFFALISLCLGTLVIVGWQLKLPILTQLHPSIAPMPYNTALCFCLSGLALFCLYQRYYKLPMMLAITLLLFSLLTLIQHIFDFKYVIAGYVITLQQMTASSAACFVLFAITSLVLISPNQTPLRLLTSTCSSSVILGFSIITLFDHVTGLVPTFGWAVILQMEVHTAVVFCILVGSVLISNWQKLSNSKYINHWLMLSIAPLVLTIAGFLQLAMTSEKSRSLQNIADTEVQLMTAELSLEMQDIANAMARMAERWFIVGYESREIWQVYATAYYLDFDSLLTIEWIDKNKIIRWVVPKYGNTARINSSLAETNPVMNALQQSLNYRIYFSEPMALSNDKYGILLLSPLMESEEFSGWLKASIDLDYLMQKYVKKAQEIGLDIQLQRRDGTVLYQSSLQFQKPVISSAAALDINDQDWNLVVIATPEFFNIHHLPLQTTVSLLTLLLLVLIIWLIFQLIEQRTQEHKISMLHGRQSAALNTMLDGLIVIDKTGIIQEVNRAAEAMFGFSQEELLGQNINCLMPAPYRAEHDGYLKRYLETGESKIIGAGRVLRGVKKNGEEFPLRLEVSRGEVFGEIFFTGVIDDMSLQVASESMLAEKEALLDTAMQASAAGIGIVDAGGGFVDVNESLCTWLGYDRSDIIGKSFSFVVPESEKEAINQLMQRLYEGEKGAAGLEHRYLCKNGGHKWGLLSAATVNSVDNKGIQIVINIVDIEEQKRLEQEIKERNKALEYSNAELEQFAYIASHDLKEPLRTLRSFSDHLFKDLQRQNQSRVKQDIAFIRDASSRMAVLIDDLLQLSRAGNAEYKLELFSAKQCIAEVAEQLRTLIHETNTQLIVEPLPNIVGDRAQIRHVFQNLISNAIKFRREGINPEIKISATTKQELNAPIVIRIEDNGIGIEPEFIPKVFGAFKKYHHQTQFEGTGIGLAIVKKVIERHKGDISVQSTVGQGTSFFITLPNNRNLVKSIVPPQLKVI